MILVEIHFGGNFSEGKEEPEDVVESYLASLLYAGQLAGDYLLSWINGKPTGQALMTGLDANKPRYHSEWGKTGLKKVVKVFGKIPVWKTRDDECPRQNVSLKASTLPLMTNGLSSYPPVIRGDNGKSVPTFLFPLIFDF